jgi:Tfp pilus assembly protein PilO
MTSGSFANRAFWVLASIALALLVLFLVVCVSMANALRVLSAEERDAKQRLAELQNAVNSVNMQELEQKNAELDAILSVLELELPQRAYVPTLLKQIESEALLTGNDVSETRQGEWHEGKVITRTGAQVTASTNAGQDNASQAQGQRYDELDLVLRFRGSYQSAFALMKAMGSLRKMLYVKEITIQRQSDRHRLDGGAEADIDFDVSAFILEPAGGFPGKVVAQVHD